MVEVERKGEGNATLIMSKRKKQNCIMNTSIHYSHIYVFNKNVHSCVYIYKAMDNYWLCNLRIQISIRNKFDKYNYILFKNIYSIHASYSVANTTELRVGCVCVCIYIYITYIIYIIVQIWTIYIDLTI